MTAAAPGNSPSGDAPMSATMADSGYAHVAIFLADGGAPWNKSVYSVKRLAGIKDATARTARTHAPP